MLHDQKRRYSRNIILPEVGEEGQQKLLNARVLVVGAGGLGSPVLLYLAASGVGNLGIIDGDVVDLSNLQRQILFETSDIGQSKAESAKEALLDLNPEINITCYDQRLDAQNIVQIIADYDIIVDGSDNFETRFLLNDTVIKAGKILVSAAIHRFEGHLYVFKPNAPCYRCIYGDIPPEGTMPNCSEAGILGSVAGTMGAMQATEIIKEIIGIGSLAGSMLLYDGLAATSRKISLTPDSECKICGR